MMISRQVTTVPQRTEAVRTRMTRVSMRTSRRSPSRKLVKSSTPTTTAAPAAMLRWRTLTETAMRTAMPGTSRLLSGPRRSRRCLNDGNVLSRSKTRSRQNTGKPGAGSKGGEGRRGRMLLNSIELSMQHMAFSVAARGQADRPFWITQRRGQVPGIGDRAAA
jgi:hypothetical protein